MQRHNSLFLLATQLNGCLWPCDYSGWKARRRESSEPRLPTPSTHKVHGHQWIVMWDHVRNRLSSTVALRAVYFLHFPHLWGETPALTKSSEHPPMEVTAAGTAICPHKHLLSETIQSFPMPRIWFAANCPGQKWENYPYGKVNSGLLKLEELKCLL